jgi:membrane protein DedA with SNARE-associated domain
LSNQLADLISTHGYWIVAVVVALESMGIPAPGETALVTAAIFAGTTQRLNIAWVIVAAAIGAIARIDARRIKLGQYLFARRGGKVVFFGRFIAVLPAVAAVLAGTNGMHWRILPGEDTMGSRARWRRRCAARAPAWTSVCSR